MAVDPAVQVEVAPAPEPSAPPPTEFEEATDDQRRLRDTARAALERGDADTAVTALISLTRSRPLSEVRAVGGIALAQIYRERGDLERAIVTLQELRHSVPGRGELEFILGNTLLDAGRLDEADSAFRRSLHVDPEYLRSYPTLAALQLERGRDDEADATLLAMERRVLRMARELESNPTTELKLRILSNLRVGFPHIHVARAAAQALRDEEPAVALAALRVLERAGTPDILPELDRLAATEGSTAARAGEVASAIRARSGSPPN